MYFFDRRVGPDPGALHLDPERHSRSEDRVAGKRSANHGGRVTDICRLRAGVDRFFLVQVELRGPGPGGRHRHRRDDGRLLVERALRRRKAAGVWVHSWRIAADHAIALTHVFGLFTGELLR